MRYTYDSDNIIVGYIRELLHSFELPKYKVYKADLKYYNGRKYIDNNKIVQYTGSSFKEVGSYRYGLHIDNVTSVLPIQASTYDFELHKYLGNYLRFLRDYNGVDLMSLYNCYSGTQAKNLNFILDVPVNNSTILVSINTDDNTNNYYLVPAKFGYTYTIGIDAQISYEVVSLLYTDDDVTDLSKKLAKNTYKKMQGSSFRYPVTYSTDIDASNYWQFEDKLCLLIKVPKAVDSSVVVLEGDYLLNCDTAGCVLQPQYVYCDLSTDIKPLSKLSLLRINSQVSRPFSVKLVEYLLKNPVMKGETITLNVKRVLDIVYSDTTFKGFSDIWDYNIEKGIYDILLTQDKINFAKLTQVGSTTNLKSKLQYKDEYSDLLCYFDKDMETITRGW